MASVSSFSPDGMMPNITYNKMMEPIYGRMPTKVSRVEAPELNSVEESKLYVGIITYDREPYLRYTLRNVYGTAAKIVIIEGHVKEYWDLPFSDYSQKVIDDVDVKKNVLYRHVGKVVDKYHLVQKALDVLKTLVGVNDFIIMMGADEAWNTESIRWLETLDKDVLWVGVPFDNFYGDFRHVLVKPWVLSNKIPANKNHGWIAYDRDGNRLVNEMYQERIFRYRDGFNYVGNHVSIKDVAGKYVYADRKYQDRRVFISQGSSIRWAHYGYVGCQEWLAQKIKYYLLKRGKVNVKNVFGFVGLDPGYRYAMTGDEFVFDGNDNKIIEVPKGYVHPWPMGKHPYAKMKREEIFNSTMRLVS